MAGEERHDPPVPPVGEQIHLPGPTYLPVVMSFGITLALVGVVLSWVVFGIGLALTIVPLVMWIRVARDEIAELPLEHSSEH